MQTLELYKKDIYHGFLILVNEHYHYNHVQLHLAEYFHHLLHKDVFKILDHFFEKYHFHHKIAIISAYRSFQEQKHIYEQSLLENGKNYTQQFVAKPHCSEHETGLAIDFGLKKENIDFICPEFPYDGICQEFRQCAYQYGFIERYAENKQDITHIAKEPWHFRYVGFPHSIIMKEQDLCLEEYHDFIKNHTIYNPYIYVAHQKIIEIFYVPMTQEKTTLCLKDDVVYQVSGNNIDGFIITTWRTYL